MEVKDNNKMFIKCEIKQELMDETYSSEHVFGDTVYIKSEMKENFDYERYTNEKREHADIEIAHILLSFASKPLIKPTTQFERIDTKANDIRIIKHKLDQENNDRFRAIPNNENQQYDSDIVKSIHNLESGCIRQPAQFGMTSAKDNINDYTFDAIPNKWNEQDDSDIIKSTPNLACSIKRRPTRFLRRINNELSAEKPGSIFSEFYESFGIDLAFLSKLTPSLDLFPKQNISHLSTVEKCDLMDNEYLKYYEQPNDAELECDDTMLRLVSDGKITEEEMLTLAVSRDKEIYVDILIEQDIYILKEINDRMTKKMMMLRWEVEQCLRCTDGTEIPDWDELFPHWMLKRSEGEESSDEEEEYDEVEVEENEQLEGEEGEDTDEAEIDIGENEPISALSDFRKKNVKLLADNDAMYREKVASRKDFDMDLNESGEFVEKKEEEESDLELIEEEKRVEKILQLQHLHERNERLSRAMRVQFSENAIFRLRNNKF
ncbi:uncharacterized protein LOC116341048 [Contarinia nasturtii]|uniref:uncharacterized protein LOC116341048 n=1 Tax=Contarinia nasturtii TaxID=265458 RepID=UPI0012D41394|nr:uncharacterized protein LOC116341048 [Contarinia nasturtii]